MVHRVALRRDTTFEDIAPDDPCLTDGWWAAEHDATAAWRWTDGDAALPRTDDFTIVEVLIGATPAYPLDTPARAEPLPDGCPTSPLAVDVTAGHTKSAA